MQAGDKNKASHQLEEIYIVDSLFSVVLLHRSWF